MKSLKIYQQAKQNLKSFSTTDIRQWAKKSTRAMYSTLRQSMTASEAFNVYPNAYTILDDTVITTPIETSDTKLIKANYLKTNKLIFHYSMKYALATNEAKADVVPERPSKMRALLNALSFKKGDVSEQQSY